MGDEAEPAVRVTLTTIYNKLIDVENKVDPLPHRLDEHEIRITNVTEKTQRNEFEIELIKQRLPKRAPWYQVVGIVFGSVTLSIALITGLVWVVQSF